MGLGAGAVASFTTSGTGCGTSESPDNDCSCPSGQIAYACWGTTLLGKPVHRGNICVEYQSLTTPQIIYECTQQEGQTDHIDIVPCDGSAVETGTDTVGVDCSSWDPSAEVALSGGVYEVDGLFFEGLIAEPFPMIACDDARLEPLTSGYYEVVDASSGSLLYELGLRDGDIPVSINGHTLASHGRTASAYGAEWLDEYETEYSLTVYRNGSYITLDYELIYPL